MTTYCGVDFHARQQLVKWCNTDDGEIREHQSRCEVRESYSQLSGEVIVGFETSGYSSWFESLLEELGHEVWIGHATEIRRRPGRGRKRIGEMRNCYGIYC
jgi:transposase